MFELIKLPEYDAENAVDRALAMEDSRALAESSHEIRGALEDYLEEPSIESAGEVVKAVLTAAHETQPFAYSHFDTDEVRTLVKCEDLERAWGHANFGGYTKREVLALAVLKCASGYHQGHTGMTIAADLGLIHRNTYTLTDRGRQYLWAAFRMGEDF